jgi:predicted nucleotidyltransferase
VIGIFFVAQLTHSPELCFARPEHREKAKKLMEFMKSIETHEKEAGVKMHGYYSNNSEHTSYLILESDNYLNISKFLGGDPLLTHHTAKITPVTTLKETIEFAQSVTGE